MRRGGRTPEESREAARLRWRLRYEELHNAVVGILGRVCPSCGEKELHKLWAIKLDTAKSWNHMDFYKRVRDMYLNRMPVSEISKLARLICKRCYLNELAAAAALRRQIELSGKGNKDKRGTGLFYWVAGHKVEQLRGFGPSISPVTGMGMWHGQYEDLGVERLEEEGEMTSNDSLTDNTDNNASNPA